MVPVDVGVISRSFARSGREILDATFADRDTIHVIYEARCVDRDTIT